MKRQQADKPIDEELLMRMMAGETENHKATVMRRKQKKQGKRRKNRNRKQKRGNCRANGKQGCRKGG